MVWRLLTAALLSVLSVTVSAAILSLFGTTLPEPDGSTTFGMLGMGLLALAFVRRGRITF